MSDPETREVADRPRWPARPTGIAYGGDYNPDQWPEEVWPEDVALMREAGVTLVSVGVFSWSRLQPAPDRWDLGWLGRVLDLLHEGGIAVDLATATATPPPWFRRLHPESLPVTSSGTRLEIGSRQHICPSSSVYREASLELVRRLAQAFGRHPAVVMWHIGNEYGDHVRECFCDASAAHFRRWLRERYRSLDALNEAWTTSVWSGRLTDWEDVQPPRDAPGPRNPGQVLDWRRFSSDALLECFDAERSVLRRLTPELPVTTNFMRLNDGVDHRRWASHEDIVSADLYPDPAAADAGEVEAALSHDLMRSLGGGRPWLLLEQARGAVDWRSVNLPKRPGLMRALSVGAVGRGADGIMFFQWRGARGGAEAFHSTMLPAGGTATRGWRDTVALGRDLERLQEVAGARTEASVALIVDWDAWWAAEQLGHPTIELRYADEALRWYAPLHAANVAVDVRGPAEDLAAYRLVVAPDLFLLSRAAAAGLSAYVERGGVLVVGTGSGVVDDGYHIPPGAHPALLRDLLGLRWEEVWPVVGEPVTVEFSDGSRAGASIQRDALDLDGAETLAPYVEGDLVGWPAVTRRSFGAGEVWYVGCVLDEVGRGRVLALARARAQVRSVAEVPAGVVASRRVGSTAEYLFLVNHGAGPSTVVAPADGREMLGDREVAAGETIALAPLDVAVLRVPR